MIRCLCNAQAPMIAYIPARAGSKRVPRKNARLLDGKPVLQRVIEALKPLTFLKGICVSTEDPAIASIALSAGAVVLDQRSSRLADDRTDFHQLLRQDVPRYLKHFALPRSHAEVLFVLATAALVPSKLYIEAYERFVDARANMLMATVRMPKSPFKALIETSRGTWKPLFARQLAARSQDLPPAQTDAGLFYYLRFGPISRLKRHWLDGKKGMVCFPVDSAFAVDVDTPEDWAELERRYRELKTLRS